MVRVRSIACAVASLTIWASVCFVACGEQFTAGRDDGAGAPGAGTPDEGGDPHVDGGASGAVGANISGNATDANDGGQNGVTGGVGNGGTTGTLPTIDGIYRRAILDDQPLVYWRMGHTDSSAVADETGGGNLLVLQGTGHETGLPGAVADADTAMGFDGVASFAIATDARALDFTATAAFTLECWARREAGGASYFQHLLSNVEGVANNRDGYVLYLLPEPAAGQTARSVFERDRPANDLAVNGAVGSVSTWAHYAAVFDGASAFLYVNGTLANTAPALGDLIPRKTPFTVARAPGGANFFKGALDEIAIYPRALNAAAIAKHVLLAK